MKKIFLLFLAIIGVSLFGVGQSNNCFPQKEENRLAYDEVGVLQKEELAQLEKKLSSFASSSSNQIVVVIVPDLCGMDRAQYATELGHEWGVGQSEFDNGVVLLIKPTGGQGERHVFIAVGYGLEGAIPDITAKRIIEYEILPEFRKGNLYQGINKGTKVIMDLAAGEYDSQVYINEKKRGEWIGAIVVLVIFILIALMFIFRARQYASVNDISFWTALWLISNTGRSHRGTWGGSSGGGFGGGGFGGFGGGGFGGGGAGGSW